MTGKKLFKVLVTPAAKPRNLNSLKDKKGMSKKMPTGINAVAITFDRPSFTIDTRRWRRSCARDTRFDRVEFEDQ